MPDFRWQPGPNACTDLKDESGALHGYVAPTTTGFRGYVFRSRKESRRPRFVAHLDHPTPEAARAWVESEVRGRGETSGGGDA